MSGTLTPGNRAGASIPHDSSNTNMNNTVTPNPHASSGSFQEDEHYGGYNNHQSPPHHNQYHHPDSRDRGGHGGRPPHYSKYPQPPPVMPMIHEGIRENRERDSYGPPSSGYTPGYNSGYEPPSYPHQPHPSHSGYSRHSYDDRDRYGHSQHGATAYNSGPYYGDEVPPPNPNPHGPPHYESRPYRGNNERDPYYSNGPPEREHERDIYPPPSYENSGGNSPGNSPYIRNHKSPYPYGNSHERPPRNDQVIFRNNYQDSGGRPSHRSDAIHSYVTAEEGPPHHYNSGSSSPERYDNVSHPGAPEQSTMYPSNVPRYERHAHAPPHAGYEDTHGAPPDGVRMVSPHRRSRMSQHHRRQFSSESDPLTHSEYGRPPPPPGSYSHPHPYPPPTYSYPPTSPMRRGHGPGHSPYPPPPMSYPNGHPHHIPLTLTNSHSFESSHRSSPPPIPQATRPTCQSISEVNPNDVLCGRGGGTNSQIGNRRFRKLVQEYQPEYLVARRKAKPHISKTIVQIVRKRGGRFLKKEESTGYLYEVGDERAEAKTSQALREGLDVRACSGSKKRDETGRETPIAKNGEEASLKRKREDELEEESHDRNQEENTSDNSNTSSLKQEAEEYEHDFSPPRSKQKIDVTDEKEEEKTGETEESKMWPATAV